MAQRRDEPAHHRIPPLDAAQEPRDALRRLAGELALELAVEREGEIRADLVLKLAEPLVRFVSGPMFDHHQQQRSVLVPR